jgi:hypothetical protein
MLSLRKSTLLSREQRERVNKCSYECIYLLETKFNDNEFTLKISGSNLNIYTVRLFDNTLKCDCLDKLNNTYCKHICFVICFIGQIYNEDTFNRNYLNDNEIKSIFERLHNNCDNDPNIIWKYIIDKYNNIKNDENKFCKENSININTDCSICYEILKEDDNNISKCPVCKNAFHDVCIQDWLKINKNCVLCRDDIWKEFKNNKYLNMDNNKC